MSRQTLTMHDLLLQSAAMHDHLCPRQVLGVRMGMLAARLFGLDLPQIDKRLLTIVETDGCFADGIAVSTGCWLGHRTLRLVDHGKIAATFIDTLSDEAIRIHPSRASRSLAAQYAPDSDDRWHTYLEGYQVMPDDLLFDVQRVHLLEPVQNIISNEAFRAICTRCGEEIINQREVIADGAVLCRACAGQGYYALGSDS